MTSTTDYQAQIAQTADNAIQEIRRIQEQCAPVQTDDFARLIWFAIAEAGALHEEIGKYLRHGMAKEVLSFRQTNPGKPIDENVLQTMYVEVAAKTADSFLRMYDISNVEGPDELRHQVTKSAFMSYATSHLEIPQKLAKMSKPKLAFEIVSTGVYVLNDHIGYCHPEREIRMGVERGYKQLMNAVARGTPVNSLPEWRMNKFYQPGIRVF